MTPDRWARRWRTGDRAGGVAPADAAAGRRLGARAATAVVALAVAGTGLAGPALAGPGTGAGAPRPSATTLTPVINPWALQAENIGANKSTVPLAQALADATNNNLLIAHPIAYQGEVAAMRKANPRLRLFAYMNAVFAQNSNPAQGPTTGVYPTSWYEKDTTGAYVRSRNIGNWMMDPANPGWIATRVSACRALLAQSGYDGCYLDMLGPASLSVGYVTGRAVDPATGQPWTDAAWISTTAALAADVAKAMGSVPVFGNGLSQGAAFFSRTAPTSQILAGLDGGVAEAWLRGSKAPLTAHPGTAAWLADLKMLTVAQAQSKPVCVLVKLWVTATTAQQQAWLAYALASFLLVTDGRSYFTFSDDPRGNRAVGSPWYSFPIGSPTGAYTVAGGVYRRTFSNGLALVNPGTTTITVSLGRSYREISGATVSSLTLPPASGMVLEPAG